MKYFARAVGIFSAGSVLGTITQVAKGKLGAVVLGASGVGTLSQLTYLWNLLYSLSGLGFYNGIVRRIAEANATDDSVALGRQLSTSLIFLTLFSCLAALICVSLAAPISRWAFVGDASKAWLVALTLMSVPLGITAQTYKGLLSGLRLIKPIVKAQVISDIFGLVIFVALILAADLAGAVIAFSLLQLIKLGVQIRSVRQALGPGYLMPRLENFAWSETGVNVGFGINSIFMTTLAVLTILLVSRWIIQAQGVAGNGHFSVAWKVSSLYFGAIYASGSSFYFPTLAACADYKEMGARVNEAISLYFFVIPPVIAVLMVLGKVLMLVLFSKEFVPAALLLAFLLPGDLFRIVAEAAGMSFLAKRQLMPYTLSYILWAAIFVGSSFILLPACGILGAAVAYLISQIINALVVLVVARRVFGFSLSSHALRTGVRGILLVAAVMLVVICVPVPHYSYPIGAALLIVWVLASWQDTEFRSLLQAGLRYLRRRWV
jgi:O-antigen/teichoic acid export membrane protein